MNLQNLFRCVCVLAIAAGNASAQILLSDDFSYADGPIHTVSGGAWTIHSPVPPGIPLAIQSGQAFIDQNDTTAGRDDAGRLLSASFDATTDNTSKIYSSFTVNFTALPVSSTSGSYFAHLKSSAANEFYARVGATVESAAPGAFRLAITNETWPTAALFQFPQDLSLNTTYRVVTRLDLATDQSTLWINPVNESSTSVTATDAISYAAGAISAYALRQGTSNTSGAPGDLFVDNLFVGQTFLDVIPEPSTTALGVLGLAAICGFRRARKT